MLANQDQNHKPRQMGVAGEDDSKRKPTAGSIWAQAKAILAAKAEKSAARKAERDSRPVPNYICYPAAFPNFDPKTGRGAPSPLPPCNVCGDRLQPMENHKCSGIWKPKYEVFTDKRKDRLEQRRDEIREVKRDEMCQVPVCSVCGEEIHDYWEDGQIHWDEHEGRPVKAHRAVDAEPDGDLDGYEDEPEEDYCEGDDDGYDCD